jgi:hypothetical protein
MALLSDVVIDCGHPASLARFWAAALDGYSVAPYDDEELARLRSIGIDEPEDDPTVLVESMAGPRLWFQCVSEPKVAKNRLHLDLRAEDSDAEAQRLLALGARLALEQPNDTLIALHDPEGNEFCILR